MNMNKLLDEVEAQSLASKYLQTPGGLSLEEIIASYPALVGAVIQKGKVSDSIVLKTHVGTVRFLIRSNRISTHDQGRGEVPFKDQVNASIHNLMRKLVHDVMPHAQMEIGLPDNAVVSLAIEVDRYPLENVVRFYMAKSSTSTSLYQSWLKDKTGTFCGINLGNYELEPNGKLPYPFVTPSTKEAKDRSVSFEELYELNSLFGPSQGEHIKNQTLVALGIIIQYLRERSIILVDTKFEHGEDPDNGFIYAIDEICNPDSSRFWRIGDDGNIILESGEPKPFSKEYARGKAQGDAQFTPAECIAIAARYIEIYQAITGKPFMADLRPWEERVREGLDAAIAYLQSQQGLDPK